MSTLFDHTDYRPVVRAWLDEHPKRSQRWLAGKLGVSPAFLSMVLAGERDLGLYHAVPLGRILGLEHDDLTYFDALVRSAHGPTQEIRRAARMLAAAMRDFAGRRHPEPAHYPWFGSWVHLAILGLAYLDGFRATAEWVAPRLWPEVEPERVSAALAELVEAGVLVERDGAWSVDGRPLGTALRIRDPALATAVRRLHQEEMEHAARSLDTFDSDRRFVASATVPIRVAALPELIAAAHRMHLELIEAHRGAGADGLVQVLVALYPRAAPP